MQAVQNSEAKKLEQKRQTIYGATFIVVLVSFIWFLLKLPAALGPFEEKARRDLFFFVPIAMPVSRWAAEWMCRVFGVSLAGNSSQSVQRLQSGELYPLEETATVQTNFIHPFLLVLLWGLLFLGIACMIPVGAPNLPLHLLLIDIALILISACIFCAAPFVWLNRKKPVLQVDDNGIAHCVGLGVRAGAIAWQEIESCELEVKRTTFGALQKQTFRFKDSNGQQLAALPFNYPYITGQHDKLVRCWLLIQKRLTGQYDEATAPPLELVAKEIVVPVTPTIRVIERDPQLPDELRRVEKPLVIRAGLNRYLVALLFSFIPLILASALFKINPLSPAAQLPATFNQTIFEGWPLWLLMLTAAVCFAGLMGFLFVAPLWWLSTTKPDLVIDDEGIVYRDTNELKPRAVKWEQIASCEVGASRPWASGLFRYILLKDAGGKQLLKMKIDFNGESDNIKDMLRVLDVIEKYLTGRVHSGI